MISQINLITAIWEELEHQGVTDLCPRQYNAIIAAVNDIIREVEKEFVKATPNMGLSKWLSSDDVGMSSRYMASVLMGGVPVGYAHPLDGDDFGRCVRLLEAVPEFKDRKEEMRNKSEQWSRLLDCWDEAEAALAADDYKTANDLVRNAVTQ